MAPIVDVFRYSFASSFMEKQESQHSLQPSYTHSLEVDEDTSSCKSSRSDSAARRLRSAVCNSCVCVCVCVCVCGGGGGVGGGGGRERRGEVHNSTTLLLIKLDPD